MKMRVRNWDKWQTYRKDRGQPPWIKVHRELMRNPEWVSLSDAQRGQLLSIWMLAADKDGAIPSDPALIRKLCYMDTDPDLELFIEQGFICGDAIVTPERRQHDQPEAETEAEREVEKECKPAPKKSTKKTSEHPIPDGFSVTEKMRGWVKEKNLPVDVDDQTERFINYAHQHDRRCRNWEAAWRNWMLKARDYQKSHPQSKTANLGYFQ